MFNYLPPAALRFSGNKPCKSTLLNELQNNSQTTLTAYPSSGDTSEQSHQNASFGSPHLNRGRRDTRDHSYKKREASSNRENRDYQNFVNLLSFLFIPKQKHAKKTLLPQQGTALPLLLGNNNRYRDDFKRAPGRTSLSPHNDKHREDSALQKSSGEVTAGSAEHDRTQTSPPDNKVKKWLETAQNEYDRRPFRREFQPFYREIKLKKKDN